MQFANPQEARDFLAAHPEVRSIELMLIDANGIPRGKLLHRDELQMALHLYLINRGILITPFHNMTLCCPSTTAEDVDKLISMLDQALTELLAIPGARE